MLICLKTFKSMNIVCALLLLYMPEENVFWMMVSICEDLVPEYYNEELFGSLVVSTLEWERETI